MSTSHIVLVLSMFEARRKESRRPPRRDLCLEFRVHAESAYSPSVRIDAGLQVFQSHAKKEAEYSLGFFLIPQVR